MQAKRINVDEQNVGVGASANARLIVPSDPREEVNFHNIWGSVSAEPQDTDANAQGTWVLAIIRQGGAFPSYTDTIINAETENAVIIACGVWSASNQTPYNSGPIHPETSRTLQVSDQLILQIVATGITAGLVSARTMLCAHTTRK